MISSDRLGRLRIRSRLLLGFGALLVITLVASVLAFQTISSLSTKVAEVARPFEVLEEAMQARAGVIAMHGEVLELALAESGEDVERALVAMVALESGVSRNLQRVAAAYPTNTFAAAMDAFAERRHVRETTVALIRSGRQAEAIENLKQRGAPAEERLERELIALIGGIQAEAIAARDAADREQYQAKLRLVGTLIGLGLLGLVMSNLITRSISRPLDTDRKSVV